MKDAVIVVDGMRCAGWIYAKNDWVCGGQWSEFHRSLQTFVNAFQRLGVKLVFIFGRITSLNKPRLWTYYSSVGNKIIPLIKQRQPISKETYISPVNLSTFMGLALKQVEDVTVYHDIGNECHQTIAAYAARHNCMAILGQHTDFIMYDTVPYISLQHLNLRTMKTVLYCRQLFCWKLGLEMSVLPLFASLLENWYVSREQSSAFHSWVCRKFDNHISVSQHKENFETILTCILKYIQSLNLLAPNNDLEKRIKEVINSELSKWFSPSDFLKALEGYNVNCSLINLYP